MEDVLEEGDESLLEELLFVGSQLIGDILQLSLLFLLFSNVILENFEEQNLTVAHPELVRNGLGFELDILFESVEDDFLEEHPAEFLL